MDYKPKFEILKRLERVIEHLGVSEREIEKVYSNRKTDNLGNLIKRYRIKYGY